MVESLINAWKHGTVFDGNIVESPVVNGKTESAISLFSKDNRGTVRGGGRPYPAFLEVPLELFLYLLKFGSRHATYMVLRDLSIRLGGDGVVDAKWRGGARRFRKPLAVALEEGMVGSLR